MTLWGLITNILDLFQAPGEEEGEAMPMPELIRFICTKHQSVGTDGVRRSDHTADMTWEQFQDYEGECTWLGVVVVNAS